MERTAARFAERQRRDGWRVCAALNMPVCGRARVLAKMLPGGMVFFLVSLVSKDFASKTAAHSG
jgi:hypothetical protein